VLRFQQLTGPVMAKGLEDTAFYRYFPLPRSTRWRRPRRLRGGGRGLHRLSAERGPVDAHGLSATATHDTKRGEDTRARLLVLSELPESWEAALGAGAT
jgi:(1->4)-alpha-D-glucan 1-alpha-D-glucosylmutase